MKCEILTGENMSMLAFWVLTGRGQMWQMSMFRRNIIIPSSVMVAEDEDRMFFQNALSI
jgi:hypothetical protein